MNCLNEELTFSALPGALRRRWRCFLLSFLTVALLGSAVAWFYASGHTAEAQGSADLLPVLEPDVTSLSPQTHFSAYRDSLITHNAMALRYLYVLSEESLTGAQQEHAAALLAQAQALQTELTAMAAATEVRPLLTRQQALCKDVNAFAAAVAQENHLCIRLDTAVVFPISAPEDVLSVPPDSADYVLLSPQGGTDLAQNTLFRVLITHSAAAVDTMDVFLPLALFSALTGLCAGAFLSIGYEVRARRSLSAQNAGQEENRS